MGHEAPLLINLASPFPLQPPFFPAVKPWFPWKQQMLLRISSAWVMEFLCPMSCSTLFNNSIDTPERLHKMSETFRDHPETFLASASLPAVFGCPCAMHSYPVGTCTQTSVGFLPVFAPLNPWVWPGSWILDWTHTVWPLDCSSRSRSSSTSRPKQSSNTPIFNDIDCLKL